MLARLFLAVAIISAVVVSASTTYAQETTLSKKHLNVLLRTAHTAPEYGELAGYYHAQAEKFHTIERTESVEMERELRVHKATKSPSRYEQARNLEMYYKARWEYAAAQEALYTNKLGGTGVLPTP
jgi:hypothetical protein